MLSNNNNNPTSYEGFSSGLSLSCVIHSESGIKTLKIQSFFNIIKLVLHIVLCIELYMLYA